MRLFVTGTEGQVVQALRERARGREEIEVIAVGRPLMDLTEPRSVEAAIQKYEPDLVVSAAAYTAVDQAEDEPDLARAVNAEGAGTVARAAASLGAPVIHLSTDYVFRGDADEPYREDDPVAPRSVYGKTKLEGEYAVAAQNPQHVILRTAWVYSPFGRNFVRTMLRLAADRDEVSVVADQVGNPTSAFDIADAILAIAERLDDSRPDTLFGTFHLAGTGSTSWAGFAEEIFVQSARRGGPSAKVRSIATSDYPTRATRPANSRLATDRLAATYGWRAPEWQGSLATVLRRLLPA